MRSFLSVSLFCLTAVSAPAQTTTIFHEDFENGLGAWVSVQLPCGTGCVTPVGWRLVSVGDACAFATAFPSGIRAVRFGHPVNCNYDGGPGVAPHGALKKLLPIALPTGFQSIVMRIWSRSTAETDHVYDVRTVGILGPAGVPNPVVLQEVYDSNWAEYTFDLTPYAGTSILPWFEFSTRDEFANDYRGWYIDEVRIEASLNPGATFCAGDNPTGPICPCFNFGTAGHGCASSTNSSGALLAAVGSASVAADTVRFDAIGLHASSATLVQGHVQSGNGLGYPLGDGLRCIDGVTTRIVTRFATGGTLSYPLAGDPSVSVAGTPISIGSLRVYQVWYRDAQAYCVAGTVNSTNGLTMTWRL